MMAADLNGIIALVACTWAVGMVPLVMRAQRAEIAAKRSELATITQSVELMSDRGERERGRARRAAALLDVVLDDRVGIHERERALRELRATLAAIGYVDPQAKETP